MPEAMVTLVAIVAGASCGVAVLAIAGRREAIDAASWVERRRFARPPSGALSPNRWRQVAGARSRLMRIIDRAGWKESPERLTALALAFSGCMTVVGVEAASVTLVADGAVLGMVGFISGAGTCAAVLNSAVARRRRRLAAELIPLLELFTLELSGGGSALSALGTVSTKLQGELARDVRRLLIASQVVESVPCESRLSRYSEHLDIPPIASLATILAASREYGTGALQGVRALASDLRHAQRRDLIAHSRKALNHVLLPAGVGVLLPFLAVVMFPAVTALQRNLH